MSATELILDIEKQGIHLSLNNGQIKINAPKGALNDDLILKIKQNKDQIIKILNYKKHQETYSFIKKTDNQKEYYKLSSAQKRLFCLYEFDKTSLAYNIPKVVKLEGNIDIERLNNSFNKLIIRHESLRTSFEMIGNEAMQRILSEVRIELACFHSERDEVERIINNFIRPFDLDKPPLIRTGLIEISSQEHILIVDMHHIITDGVSQGILIKDFMAYYNGGELPELELQYKDYAEWQQSEEQQEKIIKQKTFWLNEFVEEVTTLDLPTDFTRPLIKKYEGNSISFVISEEETSKLKSIAETNEATMFMVLLSIYNILLSKLSNQEDIVVGTPVAGRGHNDLDNIIGMFVNTLPLRIYPKGGLKFMEFLLKVKNTTLACFDNQAYQYEELINELKILRNTSRNPLFDVFFVFRNFEREELKIHGLSLLPLNSGHTRSKFDITLVATESLRKIILSFEYSTQLFRKETIERFITYFKKIVSAIVSDQNKKISGIEIITEKERQQLLYEFNASKAEYPKDKTIIELFEEQVEKTPDKIAVRYEEETITYRELNIKSDKISSYLQELCGVKEGDLVGLILEREEYLIPSIFGILKAGGAYVPIDPHYPAERITAIIRGSQLKVIITRESYLKKVETREIKIIELNKSIKEIESQEIRSRIRAGGNSLAYVIYTSGSTGKPKGVMIEHHSLLNLINYMQQRYPLNENDSYLLKTTYTFDVSAAEIFGWFLNGGTLSLLPVGAEAEPKIILDTIKKYEITHINFVPSMFSIFIEEIENCSIEMIRSLKYIFLAGEALKSELVKKFYVFNTGVKIENIYGPTEATIYSCGYSAEDINDELMVPIGKPLSNIKLYILSQHNNLQPIGVVGELCIGGVCLARGYINNEELTSEKFIENPYLKGEKLYRTGDLARWLPDGNIEYLGRIDHQVKIRGFRIELGEIESHLLSQGKIKEAIVIAKEREGEKYLVAYYVSEQEIEISELRSHLSGKLPEYMVPAYYVHLTSMPLTSNGKIDRKALPAVELQKGGEYVGPTNDIERKLLELWSEVLKLEKETISVNRNFFEMGGHSLNLIKFVSLINKKFESNITVFDIFNQPTIHEISIRIQQKQTTTSINSPYIRLNKNSKKNIYCFPGYPGFGLWCKDLAVYLNDYNLISFNFINEKNVPAHYANLIINDSGYTNKILMGYCAGGNLAFEVAKELVLKNVKVTDIILIDSTKWVKEWIRQVTELEEIKVHPVFDEINKYNLNFLKENVISIMTDYDHYISNTNISGIIKSNIHHLISDTSDKKNWKQLTTGKYKEYSGMGDHIEILNPPNLKYNAELINSILLKL